MNKVVIVDDSHLARLELKAQLNELGDLEVVAEVPDIIEAKAVIEQLQPDLLLLDINMPSGSGFDLLAQLSYVPHVIFVTAHDDFAVKSFEVNALDYLLKPVTQARLAIAIEKYKKLQTPLEVDSRFFIKDGQRCFFIALEEVQVFEAMGNYTRLHTQDRAVSVYRTLANIAERLPEEPFFRANRSWLFNIHYIASLEQESGGTLEVILENKMSVSLSRAQTTAFKQRYKL
ncbi:DNA-binding response regulator [Pseudoalteromonas aurantia]|uniref:LytR/AlgR family response regulator transcription factor n=1 Tax=Pseudoalteromonas aurantia TaxID=43654 RepID=UPI00110BB46F|nr:LytTR family DNA-binding domain-containing protein [Pseudoalteromonas aurantia]TMO60836.1 DNA-binding response regulator [Pseudoalteromonas aurantia]